MELKKLEVENGAPSRTSATLVRAGVYLFFISLALPAVSFGDHVDYGYSCFIVSFGIGCSLDLYASLDNVTVSAVWGRNGNFCAVVLWYLYFIRTHEFYRLRQACFSGLLVSLGMLVFAIVSSVETGAFLAPITGFLIGYYLWLSSLLLIGFGTLLDATNRTQAHASARLTSQED